MSKVILRVYDLSQGMAKMLSFQLLGKSIEGIWHTGIVVYGKEYFYSGGIQKQNLNFMNLNFGMGCLREEYLGETTVTENSFDSYLQTISYKYTAEKYDLLEHNCNNFTNEASQYLVGKGIPDYIVNLPNEVKGTPFFAQLSPLLSQMGVIKGMESNLPTSTPATFASPPTSTPVFASPPTSTPVFASPPTSLPTKVARTEPTNGISPVFFLENSQVPVSLSLIQASLSATASLTASDIALFPRLNAELAMKPNTYTMSPTVNDLLLKIWNKTGKTDLSLLYIFRCAIVQNGFSNVSIVLNTLLDHLVDMDDLQKLQCYLLFCNCFNTNQCKLEIMKLVTPLFAAIQKDFSKTTPEIKIAISALLQNICSELVCLDHEGNINDLTTEVIVFIQNYINERECQNYFLGGLLLLCTRFTLIKQFFQDLDLLSTINFVTHPRAYELKKRIST